MAWGCPSRACSGFVVSTFGLKLRGLREPSGRVQGPEDPRQPTLGSWNRDAQRLRRRRALLLLCFLTVFALLSQGLRTAFPLHRARTRITSSSPGSMPLVAWQAPSRTCRRCLVHLSATESFQPLLGLELESKACPASLIPAEALKDYPPGQQEIDGGGFEIKKMDLEKGYIYVQFESLKRGYIDDVEFLVKPTDKESGRFWSDLPAGWATWTWG